jgi:hypothetical protein
VTNGRLAYELMTGRLQASDAHYEQRFPAEIQVAGDRHPDTPTYATFNAVRDHEPTPIGWTIITTIDKQGQVGANEGLAMHGVTAKHYVPETNHTVASDFWVFINSSGMVYENGQYRHAALFESAFFATGLPLTEAHWVYVPVGGTWQWVLVQYFERRCLTYTPGNADGWRVEAGNTGQHYYSWRYGNQSPAPPPPSAPTPPPGMSEEAYLLAVIDVLELTHVSFELLELLFLYPTFDADWYYWFDLVLDSWVVAFLTLDSLDPPPAYSEFHTRLLEAYVMLVLAGADLYDWSLTFSDHFLSQALGKLELFAVLLDQAFELLPESVTYQAEGTSIFSDTLERIRDAVEAMD